MKNRAVRPILYCSSYLIISAGSSGNLCQNLIVEKCADRIRRYGKQLIVHRHADTFLTVTHAERAGELNLICQIVFRDHALQLLDHLTGTFYVT